MPHCSFIVVYVSFPHARHDAVAAATAIHGCPGALLQSASARPPQRGGRSCCGDPGPQAVQWRALLAAGARRRLADACTLLRRCPQAPPAEPARVAVLGASGYTGAEVVRLSALHPHLKITALTGDRQAGKVRGRARAPGKPSSRLPTSGGSCRYAAYLAASQLQQLPQRWPWLSLRPHPCARLLRPRARRRFRTCSRTS